MKVDVEKMNRTELMELRDRVDAAIQSLADREKKAALEAAEAAAAKHGFSLSDLGVKPSGRGRGTAKRKSSATAVNPPKYRHPTDPKKTWSGRGRKPQWIKDAEKKGDLKKLAI